MIIEEIPKHKTRLYCSPPPLSLSLFPTLSGGGSQQSWWTRHVHANAGHKNRSEADTNQCQISAPLNVFRNSKYLEPIRMNVSQEQCLSIAAIELERQCLGIDLDRFRAVRWRQPSSVRVNIEQKSWTDNFNLLQSCKPVGISVMTSSRSWRSVPVQQWWTVWDGGEQTICTDWLLFIAFWWRLEAPDEWPRLIIDAIY